MTGKARKQGFVVPSKGAQHHHSSIPRSRHSDQIDSSLLRLPREMTASEQRGPTQDSPNFRDAEAASKARLVAELGAGAAFFAGFGFLALFLAFAPVAIASFVLAIVLVIGSFRQFTNALTVRRDSLHVNQFEFRCYSHRPSSPVSSLLFKEPNHENAHH